MKNLFLCFLLFFFNLIVYSQIYESEKINTDDYKTLRDSTIYSLDKNELHDLLKNKKNEYTIVISWGYWCKPCNIFLPKLLELKNKRGSILNLWIVSVEPDNSKKLFLHKLALAKRFSFTKPSFMISESYGKNKFKKYDAFLIDLIGKANFKNEYRGMSQIIMYKDSNIVFLSDWNMSDDIILENIDKLLKP